MDVRGKGGSNHEVSPTKLPYLPRELITEIFLRSHARSLGRFRCLSKPFLALLSDPNFARKHVDHNTVRFGHRRLILSSTNNLNLYDLLSDRNAVRWGHRRPCNNLLAVDFDSIRDDCGGNRDLTAVVLDNLLKEDEYDLKLDSGVISRTSSVYISVSSNGLVFVHMASNASDVFLYNPTTGESKRIPDVPEYLRSSSSVTWSWFSYGFGFDPLTNDYKVVRFNVDNDNYVYSLKKDSWRRICNIPCRRVYSRTSVELNGSIHWISLISGGESQKVVMAFDLNTEKLRLMPLPDLTEECDHIYGGYTVGTLKGRLCVVRWCLEMHDVIWVMNEYGVGSSWSKIRIGVSYCQVMIPLCVFHQER
ncbi:PREDICTED: F-box/kelch-repeat protein At3g06240-like [Camelina sativa]|uniref:F-box/kelch-repeat protein At3g06240-like n=1 Tax=Camelina sativa TaxID=90675 RepID=A0ABM0U6F7_CAMSA|nr:PREDICTED: F-box/kelch-repeat protein At3g06240-like [Camelina sativa]